MAAGKIEALLAEDEAGYEEPKPQLFKSSGIGSGSGSESAVKSLAEVLKPVKSLSTYAEMVSGQMGNSKIAPKGLNPNLNPKPTPNRNPNPNPNPDRKD